MTCFLIGGNLRRTLGEVDTLCMWVWDVAAMKGFHLPVPFTLLSRGSGYFYISVNRCVEEILKIHTEVSTLARN